MNDMSKFTPMKRVSITTDGACNPNPGKGAWAFSVKGDLEFSATGSEQFTTNNRMEMQAAISALLALPEPCIVNLRTDSMYVVYAIQRKGSKKKNRSNEDLVWQLWSAMEPHEFTVEWVRGHAGDPENEFVDSLANGLCFA